MSNTMLRLPQVTEKIGLSRSTIYKMMDAGEFPKPIKLTRKAVAWPESAITEWLASHPVAA